MRLLRNLALCGILSITNIIMIISFLPRLRNRKYSLGDVIMVKRKIKTVLIFVLILLFNIMNNPVYAAQDVPKAVMNSLNSVVRIFAEYSDGLSSGSGFVVFSNEHTTLIATNNHVIEGNPIKISVAINSTERISATILATSEKKDLCILKMEVSVDLPPLRLNNNTPSQGDAIYAVGFPAAADNLSNETDVAFNAATVTDGIISAIRQMTITENGTPVEVLQISAAINSGNSGGPLFDKKGNVIGVNTYSVKNSQGIFGAIAVAELIDMMAANGINVKTYNTSFPLSIIIIAIAVLCVLLCVVVFVIKKRTTNKASNNLFANDNITETQKTKLTAKRKISIPAAIAILCFVLVGVYGGLYYVAIKQVNAGNYSSAKKAIIFPFITRLHDPHLIDYLDAYGYYTDRNYNAAVDGFDALGEYKNAAEMKRESEYLYAAWLVDNNRFQEAIDTYRSLSDTVYKDSLQKLQEARYQYARYKLYTLGLYDDALEDFVALNNEGYSDAEVMVKESIYCLALHQMEEKQYEQAYSTLTRISGYQDSDDAIQQLKEIFYQDAVKMYITNTSDDATVYNEARRLFALISPYKDSDKYGVLISGHKKNLGKRNLVNNETTGEIMIRHQIVDDLIDIFYFQDASVILLSYDEYAREFLAGTWKTNSGLYYFEVYGTTGDKVSYNLPSFKYGTSSFFANGDYCLSNGNDSSSSYRQLFHFTLITTNSLEVYCYADGSTYTLYKK